MALTEAEELELLTLERERALASQSQQNKPLLQKVQQSMTPAMEVMGRMQQSPLEAAAQVAQQIPEKAGEKVATSLAEGMPTSLVPFDRNQVKTSPEVAAAVGTGIQMAPDIAMAAAGLASPLKRIATTPFEAPKMLSGGVDKLRNIARILTGPGKEAQELSASKMLSSVEDEAAQAKAVPEALARAREEYPQVQARMAKLPSERAALVKKAGKAIQEMEKDLGPLDSQKIKQLTEDPEVANATLKNLTDLTSKGPEAVAKAMGPKEIRLMRQFVQEVSRNPSVTVEGAQAQQANSVLADAMDLYKPGYKSLTNAYNEAKVALKESPNVKAQELADIRSKIKSLTTEHTNKKVQLSEALRKAKSLSDQMSKEGALSDTYRKRAIYAALTATGLGGLKHLLGGRP